MEVLLGGSLGDVSGGAMLCSKSDSSRSPWFEFWALLCLGVREGFLSGPSSLSASVETSSRALVCFAESLPSLPCELYDRKRGVVLTAVAGERTRARGRQHALQKCVETLIPLDIVQCPSNRCGGSIYVEVLLIMSLVL